MKNLFLPFVLLISALSFGQEGRNLTFFQDYSKCLTGVKSVDGTVIFQPVFTSIVSVQQHFYAWSECEELWLVERDGFKGLMDSTGKIVVSTQYDELRFWRRGQFIASKGGRFGLIDHTEKVVLPFDFEMLGGPKLFLIGRKNGLQGVIADDLSERVPFQFQELNGVTIYSSSGDDQTKIFSPSIFEIKEGNKKGIWDANRGKMVVPPIYDYVAARFTCTNCIDPTANYIVQKDRKTGLFASDGRMIIPEGDSVREVYLFSYAIDSCTNRSDKAINYVEQENGWKRQAWNLQTAQHSIPYDEIKILGDGFVARDGGKWYVLDENFKEIFSFRQGDGELAGVDNTCYGEYEKLTDWKSGVVEYYGEDGHQGLIHFRSKKTLPAIYDKIEFYKKDGKRFYYGITWGDRQFTHEGRRLVGPNGVRVDFYDGELKRTGSYNCSNMEQVGDAFVMTKKGKTGVVSKDGSVLVSFTEGEFVRQEYQSGIVIGNKEVKTFVNPNNGLALQLPLDKAWLYPDQSFIVTKGSLKTLYSPQGKVVFSGFSEEAYQSTSLTRDLQQQVKPAFTLVKDGHLFIYEEGILKKADSEHFEFNRITRLLRIYGYEINEEGLITEYLNRKPGAKQNQKVTEYWLRVKYGRQLQPFFWHDETSGKDKKWFLYDTLKKNKIHTTGFDYPLERGPDVFVSNGKFGLFGPNFEIQLLPWYDFIQQEDSLFLLQKDRQWQIWNRKSGKFSPLFESVSIKKYNQGRFVFDGDQVGFVGSDLQMLIPLMHRDSLTDKYDLVKMLGLDKQNERLELVESYIPGMKSKVYRSLNNQLIVESSRSHTTANRRFTISFGEPYPNDPVLRTETQFNTTTNQMVVTVDPTYYSETYYSEKTDYAFYTTDAPFPWRPRSREVRLTRNYKIVNNRLLPMGLGEFLKTDAASMQQLNELLTVKVNAAQPYGEQCVDLAGELDYIKNHFSFTSFSFTFYGRRGEAYELYFSELKGLIRHPEILSRGK